MVQYSKFRITAFLMSACATLTVLAGGCSDAEQRAAARDTIENIRKANLHIDNAEALIANPVIIRADGERVKMPITKVLQMKDEKFLVAKGIVNPDALVELDQAEKIINTVTASGGAAPDDEKAMAKATLGRIYMTRGLYYSLKADIARRMAFGAMRQAGPFVTRLVSESGIIAYYEKLTAASDEDIEKMKAESNATVSKLSVELKETDGKIAVLKEKRENLLTSNRELMAEGGKLRINSGLASGKKALDLYDQARAKETKADEAIAEARKAERQISELENKREVIVARHLGEENKLTALNEIAITRRDQKRDYNKTLSGRKTAAAGMKEKIESLSKSASQACSEASEDEANSLKAYDTASSHFKAAAGLARESSTINQNASTQMAAGDLCVSSLDTGTIVSEFASGVKAAWGTGVPASVTKVADYAATMTMRKNLAKQYFTEAKNLYAMDVSMTDRKLRWVVQGQLARAHMQLYKLLGNDASREEAKRILDEAIKGRESSVHLRDVLKLRESLLTQ